MLKDKTHKDREKEFKPRETYWFSPWLHVSFALLIHFVDHIFDHWNTVRNKMIFPKSKKWPWLKNVTEEQSTVSKNIVVFDVSYTTNVTPLIF